MKQRNALLRKHFGSILSVSLLNILCSLAMVCAGYSLSFLFTAYEYDGDKTHALLATFGVVIAIWLVAMGALWVASLAQAKAQQRIKNSLRDMVVAKITSQDYATFTRNDSGHHVSWLTNDIDQMYSNSSARCFRALKTWRLPCFRSWHCFC